MPDDELYDVKFNLISSKPERCLSRKTFMDHKVIGKCNTRQIYFT